jgi:hypothetical protein
MADYTDVVPLNRMARRKSWPRSILGILPYGSYETVHGLCQWLTVASSASQRGIIFMSFAFMTRIIQPLIIPHLIVSDAFLEAISAMGSVDWLISAHIGNQTHEEEHSSAKESITAYSNVFSFLYVEVVSKLTNIERMMLHSRSGKRLYAGYKDASLVIERGKTYVEQHLEHEDCECKHDLSFQELSKSLRRLTRFVDLLRGELGANVRLFESMERDQLQPDSIVLPLLAKGSSVELQDESVHQLAESHRCAAPTCPVTMADCHLKLCTGCKVAKYCSRRCQKRAWTHVTTSHRM